MPRYLTSDMLTAASAPRSIIKAFKTLLPVYAAHRTCQLQIVAANRRMERALLPAKRECDRLVAEANAVYSHECRRLSDAYNASWNASNERCKRLHHNFNRRNKEWAKAHMGMRVQQARAEDARNFAIRLACARLIRARGPLWNTYLRACAKAHRQFTSTVKGL
jgi:hypothetical protein